MTDSLEDVKYGEYLEQIQSDKSTDKDLIEDVVLEGTGVQTDSLKRIISGEINEVYDVLLEDGRSVIARINTSDEPTFDQELWALKQCKENDVPVPGPIFMKQICKDNVYISFLIQEKLKGKPLGVGQDILKIDEDKLDRIIYQAGEILSKINGINVNGFGHLNGEGKGTHKSFNDILIERIQNSEKYADLFSKYGFTSEEIFKLFSTIENFVGQNKQIKPFLVHGDFGPKHIMFEDDKVTGILDFGDVIGSSPIYDFARWEYFYGKNKVLSILKKGYQNKKIFKNSDTIEISKIIQLDTGLITLDWYDSQKYEKGINYSIKKVREILSDI